MKNKMMIRRILIGLFLGIVVTSCTHNDGYIGPLFGKWQLIEMWENGTMTPHDSLYYNFQSSVIKLQLVHRGGIENATDNYFGSYVREDDILKFKIMEPSWFETELPPVFKLKLTGAILYAPKRFSARLTSDLNRQLFRELCSRR